MLAEKAKLTEKAKPLAVALAIAVRQDRRKTWVLAIKRRDGDARLAWAFPGGKIEAGECPKAAAKRELREETGIVASWSKVIGERIHPISGVHIYYVSCGHLTGEANPQEVDRIESVEWVPAVDLDERFGSSLSLQVVSFLKMQQLHFRF